MDDIGKAIAGFVAGVGELSIGLTFFAGDLIMKALKPLATSPESASVMSTYASSIAMLTIGLIIINIVVGYLFPLSFSIGFLCGDFLMIALLAGPLMQIAPSVVTDMVIALIAVLVGIILKIYLKNREEQRNRRYENWY